MCNNNNNCNKTNCNCKNQCNNCEPVDCGCKIELDTLCVYYTGQGISPLGVKSGQNLTDILELINNYLEFLLDELETLSAIKNIGDGAEIYAGRDEVTRQNTLRTLKSSDYINCLQNEKTISLELKPNIISSVGEPGLDIYNGFNTDTKKYEIKRIIKPTVGVSFLYNNPLVPNNISQKILSSLDLRVTDLGSIVQIDSSAINENLGNKTEVYKGYSSNNKHQFKTLESTDNSLSFVNNESTVDIKVGGGVLPIGSIVLWYGLILDIPSGYSLCDGSNSTPDLRDKFVVGASQDSNGVASTTIEGSPTVTGGSKDAILVEHGHDATSTVTDPGHKHAWGNGIDPDDDNTGGDDPEYTTQVGIIPADQSPVLSAQTGISVNTSVNNQGESATNKNLPPYYALAYIMFTGNN